MEEDSKDQWGDDVEKTGEAGREGTQLLFKVTDSEDPREGLAPHKMHNNINFLKTKSIILEPSVLNSR